MMFKGVYSNAQIGGPLSAVKSPFRSKMQRHFEPERRGGTAFDTRIEEALDVLTLADLPPRGSTG
jgi:hypothetical protein